ncbi:MAG: hypothetical protein ABJB74_16295 [Gemmatimonas sp.]
MANDPSVVPRLGVLSSYLISATAALLLASLIQNDSPTRVDAYWRTTPTKPRTLFAAKLVTILLALLVPAIVAECVALAQFTSSVRDIVEVTVESVTRVLGALLAIAIVAGAAPTFKGFALALIGLLIVELAFAGTSFLNTDYNRITAWNALSWPLLLAAAIQVAWLGSMYIARNRSIVRTRVLSAIVIISPTIGPAVWFAVQEKLGISVQRTVPTEPSVPANVFAVVDRDAVVMHFDTPLVDDRHRLSLADPHFFLTSPTAGRIPLHLTHEFSGLSRSTAFGSEEIESMNFVPGTQSYAVDSSIFPNVATLRVRLVIRDSLQLHHLREQGLRVEFDGFLESQVLDTVSVVAIDLGRTQYNHRQVIRSTLVPRSDSGSILQIEAWSFAHPDGNGVDSTFDAHAPMFNSSNADSVISRFMLSSRGIELVHTLVSQSGRDRLLLKARLPQYSELFLPIPVSSVRHGTHIFEFLATQPRGRE